MDLRCSPCNSLLFLGILGILLLCGHQMPAQCQGNFTFQSVSSQKGSASGRIEVSIKDATPGTYTFTVYEMNGAIAVVQTKQASTPERVIFENLKPSTYLIKIEWGESCHKVLGGLEGIMITEKDQGR
jgi:hypothetical protein